MPEGADPKRATLGERRRRECPRPSLVAGPVLASTPAGGPNLAAPARHAALPSLAERTAISPSPASARSERTAVPPRSHTASPPRERRPRPASVLAALALALLPAPACLVEYAIGGATATATDDSSSEGEHASDSEHEHASEESSHDSETCPEGQDCCGQDTCPDGQVLCGSGCVAESTCCTTVCDPVRERCDGDQCRCRDGLVLCGDDCVDTRSDPRHCGECDNDCGDNGVCSKSDCVEGCGDGLATCDGACVDVAIDPLHCDACDKSCSGDQVCLAGACHPYEFAGECLTCPCPEVCAGDLAVCCDSAYLGAAVCVDDGCG